MSPSPGGVGDDPGASCAHLTREVSLVSNLSPPQIKLSFHRQVDLMGNRRHRPCSTSHAAKSSAEATVRLQLSELFILRAVVSVF